MTGVSRLFELAAAAAGREASESLPVRVLATLVDECSAHGGTLGVGDEVVARWGSDDGSGTHHVLGAGRDAFWIELTGGTTLEPMTRGVAGLVLAGWRVREELKKARFAERRRLWEVESLRAIAEAIGGTLDPRRIAEELLLHATALLDARRGEVWLTGREGLGLGARLAGPAAVGPCADNTCTVAARIGGAILTTTEAAGLPDAGLVEAERLAVTISGRRGRLAVVALAEREVRGGTTPFGPTDAETLQLFAAQAAVALENAHLYGQEIERQRLEQELELAATIQRQLLPREFPALAEAIVAARTEASRHVGGDLYGLIPTRSGTVVFLADISGKGIPAALMAASLHAAVQILAQSDAAPAELAIGLHAHLLAATPENKFATVFLARLERDGWLEYVSAGHNPALVVAPDGGVTELGATGTPLGLLPDAQYESTRVQVPPDGVLVAYSDGFTEAPGPDGDDWGLERFTAVVRANRDQAPTAILEALFSAVAVYTAGAPPHDDRTALVLRRNRG